MNKIYTQLFVLCFSFVFGYQTVISQDRVADLAKGILYVKMKNDMGASLPEFSSRADLPDLSQQPELETLIQKFPIQRLIRPFLKLSEDLDHTYMVNFDSNVDMETIIREIRKIPGLEYVEGEPIYQTSFLPNDYNPVLMGHLEAINAQGAWDITKGSENVVIAIVDDAIDIDHPDLEPNLWTNPGEIAGNGIDDDGNGYIDDIHGYNVAFERGDPSPENNSFDHGTLVAGSAAAATDNGLGISAIGYNCRIMAVAASGISENINFGTQGVAYAITAGADIVNMSFGGPGINQTMQSLIQAGHERGIIFVASSGNFDSGSTGTITSFRYPASYRHVISVGSTNNNDIKASFSVYNDSLDIMAPGVSVRTTSINGQYLQISGTSFSSPIVAGVLGLMKSANPCLSPIEAEQKLKESARNIDAVNPNFIGDLGAGMVDAQAAVASVVPSTAPSANFAIVLPNPEDCSNLVRFEFDLDAVSACPSDFFWTFTNDKGFVAVSSEQNPSIELPDTANYTATLIVANTLGSNQSSQTLAYTPTQSYELSVRNNLSLCLGDRELVTATTTAAPSVINSIQWFPTTGVQNPSSLETELTTTLSTDYTLSVELENGCILREEIAVSVSPTPTTFIIAPSSDVTIQKGESVNLNTFGAEFYSWSPTLWLSDPNIENPVATPEQTVRYTVTGSNDSGCTLKDSILITVEGTFPVSIDNEILSYANISPVFPNPTDAVLNFSAKFKQRAYLRLNLIDLMGKRVGNIFEGNVFSGDFSFQWERNSIANGLYLIQWEVDGKLASQRVVLR